MQQYIFDPLGVVLLSVPPQEKTVSTFVEHSHHSDDGECYALNLGKTTTKHTFLSMAQKWILTYNFRCPHFGRENSPGGSLCEKMCILLGEFFQSFSLMRDFLTSRSFWGISIILWDNSPNKKGLVNEILNHYSKSYL